MKLRDILNADFHEIAKNTEAEESYWEIYYRSELLPKPLLEEVIKCFWQSPFMQQTMKVRELQRQYYKHQQQDILRLCKQEERKLDEMIQKTERFLKRNQLPPSELPVYQQQTIG